MGSTFYKIAPYGDTLLILHNANAPFAALPPSAQGEKQKQSDTTSDDKTTGESEDAGDESKDTEIKPLITMQLSSKHLSLASAYFQKLTDNNWKEAMPDDDEEEEEEEEEPYAYVVNANDWDEQALLILMNIIHGRTAKVPRSVNLEMLAKIAVLVDYYQCHEAVEFFAQTWLGSISMVIPKEGERDFMLRLVVSLVFSENFNFWLLTKAIIQNSTAPVDSLGLPIGQTIIDALNKKREEAIADVLNGIRILRKRLGGDQKTCSFECSSINLGALLKFMTKMGLVDPPPRAPFPGLSILKLEQGLRVIKEPSWKTNCLGLSPSREVSTKPAPAQSSNIFGGATSSTRNLPAQTVATPIPVTGLFGNNATSRSDTSTSPFSFGTPAAPRAASLIPITKPAAPLITSPNPTCTLRENTKPIIDKLISNLSGLRLTDYVKPQ